MKKNAFLVLAMFVIATTQAQWVDDPMNNTLIANCSNGAAEVYTSTDPVSGDTYVQWNSSSDNGWAPTLQRLNLEGVPQWGSEGIHISGHQFGTYSEGVAMAATTDNAVVSCFSNEGGQSIAIKINADGSFAWGEQGVALFDGQGGSRTEVLAGNDGGAWVLGTDYVHTFLCYLNADGSANPTITISDNEKDCLYGSMTLCDDNSVFVTFEKEVWAFSLYYDKEIYIVGYSKDGTQISPETQLMTPYTIGGPYQHQVVPDGLGGGYAYIWHPAIGDSFNTYVFHYDANGNSTISNLDGVPVHVGDIDTYFYNAYGTVDPVSHDLIIAFKKTDALSETQDQLFVNRITADGQTLWGDGIMIADYEGVPYNDIRVDAYEDGTGFAVVYAKGIDAGGYATTVESVGFDMNGNRIWSKQLSSNAYGRSFSYNSSGFLRGQNIITWVNSDNGGLYGQNICPDGTIGPVPSTSIDENTDEEITSLLRIYTINGQLLQKTDLEGVSQGIYILQGLTSEGKTVSRKVVLP